MEYVAGFSFKEFWLVLRLVGFDGIIFLQLRCVCAANILPCLRRVRRRSDVVTALHVVCIPVRHSQRGDRGRSFRWHGIRASEWTMPLNERARIILVTRSFLPRLSLFASLVYSLSLLPFSIFLSASLVSMHTNTNIFRRKQKTSGIGGRCYGKAWIPRWLLGWKKSKEKASTSAL